jgi:hypothetical protein
MLSEEPADPSGPRPPARSRTPCSPMTIALLTIVAIGVIVLRHDYWNWDTPYPLLLGFLPVGLWWQGLVSVLACAMMWLMVRFAWPQELEEEVIRMKDEGGRRKDG